MALDVEANLQGEIDAKRNWLPKWYKAEEANSKEADQENEAEKA